MPIPSLPLRSLLLVLAAVPLAAQAAPDHRLDVGSAPGGADAIDVQLAFTGDSVYAVWLDFRSGQADVYCNVSRDAGATWGAQDVRLDTGTAAGSARSTEVRVAADGDAVFVVWTEDAGAPHVLFNRSLDGGATWLPTPRQLDAGAPGDMASQPTIACLSQLVFVAWSESRGGLDADIWFDRSLDGGATWLGSPVRLDTGAPQGAPGASTSPSLAIAIPNVYVAWDDLRANYGVYFNRSFDLGATWQATDVQLNSAQSMQPVSSLPQVAALGSAVHVCWTDARFGGSDIFVQSSADGGATWLANDARVDVGNLPGTVRAGQAVIAVSATAVHVAWRDSRNNAVNGDIYYNRSQDGGVTWGSTDVRLDTGSPIGATDSNGPQLAVAGAAVAAVWSDNRMGSYDILANTSPDDGATWLAIDLRVESSAGGASDSMRPVLASNGASWIAAWDDARNGTNANDVYATLLAGWQPYGAGLAGIGGAVPALRGTAVPALGATARLEIANALGAAPALVAIGLDPQSRVAIPLLGGTLLVNPGTSTFVLLGGAPGVPGATATLAVPLPTNPALLGANANFQALLLDAGAAQGVAMTNGLALWIG